MLPPSPDNVNHLLDAMEFQWEAPPLSIAHKPHDWQDHSQAGPGPSSVSPPSSFPPPLTSRRRSSAANVPPAGPPPSQPIPSLPPHSEPSPNARESLAFDQDGYSSHMPPNGMRNIYAPYTRPGASANLTAVAAFSQRNVSSGYNTSQLSASSSADNLSDPPPKSILHNTSSRALNQHQEIVPDRLLLSPPEPRTPAEIRPSSRRALTKALELAREAVKLDSTNDDPYAAVMAYGRSVALLSEVMERVRRGEDSTEARTRRNGRRRSVVAQEEEVRRLKSIHDTYADRMNILSLIYSIPPIPHSPTAVYASAGSTQPPSPTSNSPSSDSSDPVPQTPSAYIGQNRLFVDRDVEGDSSDDPDGTEAIGSAMFMMGRSNSPRTIGSTAKVGAASNISSAYHPYATTSEYDDQPVQETNAFSRTATQTSGRSQVTGQILGRPRNSSYLPPPQPPPSNALPPAPGPTPSDNPLGESISARTRYLDVGPSAGHKRTGSGNRLTVLQEEASRYDDYTLRGTQPVSENDDALRIPSQRTLTPHTARRDSHPLPPLPSPTTDGGSQGTPRNNVSGTLPQSPTSTFVSPRPRGESSLFGRSESWASTSQLHSTASHDNLINASPMQGTIHLRRSKASAPPTASPVDPLMSAPSTNRIPNASLPSINHSTHVLGRNRSSSQPGRRPSLISGRVSPFDPRPPLPQTANINGGSRKPSYSSKLNPSSQPPQLIIQTELPPQTSIPPGSLVPPPSFAPAIPTTPTSPLPPAPPPDALRKPYHMMNLLRNTMISKTGGYVTRRLHVPQEVWSQGGAKLNNVLEKVRVVEVLCSALEELQHHSVEHFGAGNVSSGMAHGIGSIGRKEGEAWVASLEEFSSVCDGVVANFGKKLGVGEGFVLKKTSGVTAWGGILARQFDKVTKGKNLDSPAAYVSGLTKLFLLGQLLDEHTKAICAQPLVSVYSTIPADGRSAVEAKLKRASEFFASVVLTFVIRDLSQLLDKYAKKCEKWLAE